MSKLYKGHIPETVAEVSDWLGWMMLHSPTFKDAHFSFLNIDTTFFALSEGLKNIQKKVGEEHYARLVELSARMRVHFEADPEDKTEDALLGRDLILEMKDLLANGRPRP